MSTVRTLVSGSCPRALTLVLFTSLAGCAFIPTPVRLVNKPHSVKQQAPNGIRVCIIVKDERPEAMQKINMCGLMRNVYMIPTSIAFLAHSEHLEAIAAYHLKENFQHLGYEVVAAYPSPPSQLSEEKRQASSASDILAGMKGRHSQKDPDAMKKGREGTIRSLDGAEAALWGPEIVVSQADLVVEVKIRKFFSDCNWLGVFAWASVNMTVCRANSSTREVLFGRKLKGFGYGTGITPLEAYAIPINTAYWFVMHGIEKAVGSPEFQRAVSEALAGDV